MDEVAALTPMFAGVNYQRLEGYKSLQWPVAADGSDQPLLYTKASRSPTGRPACIRSHGANRRSAETPSTTFI
jgi:predicted molibdopterin-dependent oxidoreductase YjgC